VAVERHAVVLAHARRLLGRLLPSSPRTRPRSAPSAEELAPPGGRELGAGIDAARLLRERELQLGQQRALLQAAQAVAGELDVETVLRLLVDQVAELLDADAADCSLLEPDRSTLRCVSVRGLDPGLVGFSFPARTGLAGRAIADGRPVTGRGDGGLHGPVSHPAYEGFASALVAPLTWAGETRGVLGVGVRAPSRVFGERDTEALASYATIAALALRNAERFRQREREAAVERSFARIASLLGEPVALTATIDAVAHAAAEAFGGDRAAVLVAGPEGFQLAGGHDLSAELRALFAGGIPEGAEALAHALAERRAIVSSQLADDERFSPALRQAAAAGSLLAIPIAAPRAAREALAVVFFAEPRSFGDDDLELADQLAARARVALERSELFEVERRSRVLAQQLAETGSLFSGELEPDAVLDEVVEQAPVLLGADAASIRLLEGDELVTAAVSGPGRERASGAVPADARPAGAVVESRAPVAIEDVAGDESLLDGEPMLARGYAAYLGVPLLRAEGDVLGVLAVCSARPRRWLEEEVEALGALAANASVAYAKAELYQQVELERERSVAILANVADGIVAVDREEVIVLWNAAAERITGVPSEEAVGRTVHDVLQRELRSASPAGSGDRLVPIRRGDREVWLSLTEAVMRDPAGETAGRIFAFRDISAERVVEQMRSDFVSTVSHELRAPLTSIYGFAATLLREDVAFAEEERRTFLGYIESEAQRLTGIVDKLLSVARLDAGDLELELAPVDVRSLVSEVVEVARADAGANGHEFVVDLPDSPLSARTDAEKLRQVLANLVDNAVRFSPNGGRVTVGAARRGETIVLSVADQGVGIPAVDQERIFSKFYRVGDAQTGGTGVGLFIAQGLVGALGGRITVRSAEGRGSSFVVELPAREGEGSGA
jgi:PAS domain S-box-containing protein